VSSFLDHRLLFVTGKGGVGKSTVATAIGLVGARQGLRTIVAELSSQKRIQRAFDAMNDRLEEVELISGLFAISIDPKDAIEEYLRVKLGFSVGYLDRAKCFRPSQWRRRARQRC
jgi:anion-transporting  ArsA/GET3 family ATPase